MIIHSAGAAPAGPIRFTRLSISHWIGHDKETTPLAVIILGNAGLKSDMVIATIDAIKKV